MFKQPQSSIDEIRDIRDALELQSIEWRTPDILARLHKLADPSLFAVQQVTGFFAIVDKLPDSSYQAAAQIWLNCLLQKAVESLLLPDTLPHDATTWEAQAKIWDSHEIHSRQLHMTGLRILTEAKPWSIREAVRAAWNIEFATIGRQVEIGPIIADSAHRAALRAVADLWREYKHYVEQASDSPSMRPALWDAFNARWQSDRVLQQCDIARAQLSKEYADICQQMNKTPPAQGTGKEQGPTHSADFTAVNWYGTQYTFALGVQSGAVKALWEEWEQSGLGLHQQTIRQAVDAERDNFRMDKAFRNNRAFGTMIQSIGDGRYKLVEPSKK